MKNNTSKVAVVTGSSSGIGFEASLLLAQNGFKTYATMRDLSKSENILDIAKREKLSIEVGQLDVTKENSVDSAISGIIDQEGHIDVLVNNAGYGLMGPAEEIAIDELREQFETNLFGVLRTTKKVLPIMRENKRGTIINLSSIVGKIGVPVMSGYISSKFALEGFTESMRYELEPFGIKTVLIEPGATKTNFLNSTVFAEMALDPRSPYRTLIQEWKKVFVPKFETGSSSVDVANVILQAATSANPRIRYTVESDTVNLFEARKEMSDTDFDIFLKENYLQDNKKLSKKGGEK